MLKHIENIAETTFLNRGTTYDFLTGQAADLTREDRTRILSQPSLEFVEKELIKIASFDESVISDLKIRELTNLWINNDPNRKTRLFNAASSLYPFVTHDEEKQSERTQSRDQIVNLVFSNMFTLEDYAGGLISSYQEAVANPNPINATRFARIGEAIDYHIQRNINNAGILEDNDIRQGFIKAIQPLIEDQSEVITQELKTSLAEKILDISPQTQELDGIIYWYGMQSKDIGVRTRSKTEFINKIEDSDIETSIKTVNELSHIVFYELFLCIIISFVIFAITNITVP